MGVTDVTCSAALSPAWLFCVLAGYVGDAGTPNISHGFGETRSPHVHEVANVAGSQLRPKKPQGFHPP
jgi:hypothetical protein